MVYISEAAPGGGHWYICGHCGELLIPVRGEERDWHYRHKVDSDCDGAPMTMIHRMAEQILLEHRSVRVSARIGYLSYLSTERTPRIGHYLADVALDLGTEKVYIEILVTSASRKEKVRYYRNERINAIEIDLSKVPRDVDPEELKRLVLDEVSNRKILYWPEDALVVIQPVVRTWTMEEVFEVVVGIVIVGLLFYLIWPKPVKPKRRYAYSYRRYR